MKNENVNIYDIDEIYQQLCGVQAIVKSIELALFHVEGGSTSMQEGLQLVADNVMPSILSNMSAYIDTMRKAEQSNKEASHE